MTDARQMKIQWIAAEFKRLNAQLSDLLEQQKQIPRESYDWWQLQDLISEVEDEIEALVFTSS